MSKVKIRIEVALITDDEDEVIGIKEAIANLVEPWRNIEKPVKVEIIDHQIDQAEIESMFEEFWREYPRKTNKIKAFKAFKKEIKNRKMLEDILAALAQHKKTEQWKKPTLIPHASTWLNGHRWEDDLSTLIKTNPGDSSPAAYDLDEFEYRSLHSELKYERKKKRESENAD